MRRILFVDDDLNILKGLKRMLRPMRHEWDMEFASSGQEALDIMSKSHFDVVVSDMRMPEMDGCKLLEIVMKQYPECVRIILSGHSDHEIILGSVKFAHQYLMKPCGAEVVKLTINRACGLRDLLGDEALEKIVAGMKDLPSLPKSYNLIVEEMQKPEPSLKKVGNIIARDVSMSARVLQLVNSAFFGLPQNMVNPQQAVIYLGVETLKALVLSANVFSSFTETSELLDFPLPELCKHSIAVGNLAREILDSEPVEQRLKEEVLVAGLLHDIGKLLLLNVPDQYKQIQALNDNIGCGILTAEYEVLNTSHSELGAYLLGLWGIPIGIVESIAFHHNPSRLIRNTFDVSGKAFEENSGNKVSIDSSGLKSQSNSMNVKEYTTLTAVHVANALMNQEDCSSGTTDFKYIDMRYLRALDLADKLPEWVECCDKIRQRGD
ncbi:MAG: HDOD domain-containing protein [Candidatus Scalindua sp.]